ncbi:MAG TPA: MBL fold metallo-hydrolase [Nocardioides sp.]|jgi:glyoxylase-like metal-dependent hydrolase (beta-lactamase superfamily II)|uniref:MBL fold metallo-hydrolase n=1 Tax=Nocardioides sp. TaxID=35761 RepID=UPI002E32E2CB|nr:MBL fold metallo-hydrolase [Nocardioides sp.]HEX3931273.1 MBL fold metallo-hydrolase [Nocardioides sp.]
MTSFEEVADRVWVARQEWYDLNVCLVGGSQGLLVVDTQASARAARVIVEDVRALGVGEVTAVFNTHEHFDHTFGNVAFRAAYGAVPIHAHEVAAEHTVEAGERIKELFAQDDDDPHRDEVVETEIVVADHTFSSVRVLDLGDRQVELAHPGRGHTAGDAVLRVADADVVIAGDLVEEGAPPGFGDDCHPLDWPGTLDVVLSLMGRETVVVPGHGARVDRDFVEQQRQDLAITAQTIRDLAAAGVPVERALAEGEWPFPRDALSRAVTRGYAALPAGIRTLPLA